MKSSPPPPVMPKLGKRRAQLVTKQKRRTLIRVSLEVAYGR